MPKEDKAPAWRRELLIGGAAVIAASAMSGTAAAAEPQDMQFQRTDTAVVFIDPQNDVLSEKGANWTSVGASVTENRTVENMERIFKAAKAKEYEVFISPHYFYPTDSGWKFNGPLESDEFRTHSFARRGPLNLTGFPNSGADWLDRFKPYITCALNLICASFSSAASRWPWSRTQPPDPGILNGATAIKRR